MHARKRHIQGREKPGQKLHSGGCSVRKSTRNAMPAKNAYRQNASFILIYEIYLFLISPIISIAHEINGLAGKEEAPKIKQVSETHG